jgi:hypothetical protein
MTLPGLSGAPPPEFGKQARHEVPRRRDELDIGAGSTLAIVVDVHVRRELIVNTVQPDELGAAQTRPGESDPWGRGCRAGQRLKFREFLI